MFINKNLKNEIEKLVQVKEINMNIADMLLSLYPYEDALDVSYIKGSTNEKDAVFAGILNFFGIPDDDQESIEIAEKYIKNGLQKYDVEEFANNPYSKAIKPKPFKENGYELTYLKYAPYQLFPADEIDVSDYPYEEFYKVGYFSREFNYLALLKNNEIWMSVNPNEINTMKPYINESYGNVLVFGLGMGYIAYMMSLKDEVSTITIVEKDINIINIFKKYLFPQFSQKQKIKIVHDDAFRYFENNYKFDYIFADLWHNPEDGIPMYIRFEKMANDRNVKINYWLNDSLKSMKRRCLITIFEEYFMGYTDKDYRFAKNANDQTINHLYSIYKNKNIQNIDDIKNVLD